MIRALAFRAVTWIFFCFRGPTPLNSAAGANSNNTQCLILLGYSCGYIIATRIAQQNQTLCNKFSWYKKLWLNLSCRTTLDAMNFV